MGIKQFSTALVLSVISSASLPAFAQTAPETGAAVVIPSYAMRDLLRCRHQNRPEEQCFARLSQEVDSARTVAQNTAGARN